MRLLWGFFYGRSRMPKKKVSENECYCTECRAELNVGSAQRCQSMHPNGLYFCNMPMGHLASRHMFFGDQHLVCTDSWPVDPPIEVTPALISAYNSRRKRAFDTHLSRLTGTRTGRFPPSRQIAPDCRCYQC